MFAFKNLSSFPASLIPHRLLSSFRGMTLRCHKDRDYSSDFPLRYVPKKAREELGKKEKDLYGCYDSDTLRLENVPCLTSGTISNENNNMCFLLDDDSNDDDDFMKKSGDIVADFGNPDKKELVLNVSHGSSRSIKDAEKVAIKLLAGRAYTALELKKKLIGKRFALNTIDAVITEFNIRGLINDSLYAEGYSRSRWMSSTWGPRRIKQALFTKGVNAADTEKAVNLVFQEGQCDEEEESKHGLSKASLDRLYAQASKQWLRSQGTYIETRKSRIVRWLQYRGFNWNVISFILKKLESL